MGYKSKDKRNEAARLYRKHKGPEYFRKLTRETYYRHQEEYQQRGRERNFQLKLSVIGHYSEGDNRCRHCGESRLACLSIDHMNGLGTKNRRALHRSGTPFYQWLKTQNYPNGFQVLCMNCQFIKKNINQECPRKTQ